MGERVMVNYSCLLEREIDLDSLVVPEIDLLARQAELFGIGESLHGCGTFHRAMLNVARYLIERHDYRLFQLEAPSISVNSLQDFIDGRTAELPDHFWANFKIWLSEELLDFIYWLRTFNSKNTMNRVFVRGFDVQIPLLELHLLEKSGEECPALKLLLSEAFEQNEELSPQMLRNFARRIRKKEVSIGPESIEKAINQLDPAGTKGADRIFEVGGCLYSNVQLHGRVRDWLRTLRQSAVGARDYIVERDRAMANEVLWAQSAHQTKSIVIGHNGHLVFDARNLQPVTDQQGHSDMMGSFLKQRLGIGYQNLGVFSHRLTVWDIPVQQTRSLTFSKGLESVLATNFGDCFFWDPATSSTGFETIGRPGSWTDPDDSFDHAMEGNLRTQFSLMLFIKEGHPFIPAKKNSSAASS